MKLRVLGPILVGLLVLALLPLAAAAVTNSEVIAIMTAAAGEVRLLAQDAYCAAGVVAFCP